MVVHWLAEGLDAREIAQRVRVAMPAAIEAGGNIAGGARSLSLNRPSSASSAQKQVSAAQASPMTQPFLAASKGNVSPSP